MSRYSLFPTALVCLILAACSAQETPEVVTYQCESGQTISVTFFQDTAAFRVGERDYLLPSLTLDDFQDRTTRMVIRPSGMTLQFNDEVVYWGCQSVE